MQPFFYNVLPKIKDADVQHLNLSIRVAHHNKNILREIKSLRSLTLKISAETEADCQFLRNLTEENGNKNFFDLETLNLINTESNNKLALNAHLIEFIKSQSGSLKQLTINNFNVDA